MMSINPFSALADVIPPSAIQGFVLAMLALIRHWNNYSNDYIIKMLHIFSIMQKKQNFSCNREIGAGERASILAKQ